MIQIENPQCPIQTVYDSNGVLVDILREDLNDPLIQGNKFRKLKFNLIEAYKRSNDTLLTFGGAYSNHIYATAAAGNRFGFKTIGIIRGEELTYKDLNPTLATAQKLGMELKFISREEYRKKDSIGFLNDLKINFPNAYIIPEGGTNELAVKGCTEILDARTASYDFICLSIGTGGTIAGVIKASQPHQTILGFPALKNAEFLKETIQQYTSRKNYEFINAYHFGGYAKFSPELIKFVNDFFLNSHIPLDPIYNGKMMYGIMDMIQNNYFQSYTRILMIHTGGLQGIAGFNKINKNKIAIEK